MLLIIEKLIYGGDGLARTPPDASGRSMAVFVPFVLPGEKIEAEIRREKPGFARGTAIQLIESSPDRIVAGCPYFQQCGGCHYQHIAYERQIEFKAAILRETLQRIAKIELKSGIHLHRSPPWNYRNRARLQVQTTPEFALGYFRLASREFLPVRECPISSPLINRTMARLHDLRGSSCPAEVEEIELFADAGDERALAIVYCSLPAGREDLLRWGDSLQRELPALVGVTFFASRDRSLKGRPLESPPAQQRRSARPSRRQEESAGPMTDTRLAQTGARELRYKTANHDYQVSAGAFFQVNRHLIDELIAVVTGNTSGNVALDLYAGGGLFSAALAKNFHHIFSVEPSQTANADIVHNVPANVKAVCARTEDYLSGWQMREKPDLVVLDPPRTGAGKAVVNSLVNLGAPLVRYVSCDPATLARDIDPLLAAGYRIEEMHLFDLFPETFHIESVVLLAR
jgi:23S rRNA (uracil1939-C5)-methyltransferase